MYNQFEATDVGQFFQNVFNGADLVVFTLDTEYKYTFFNKKHSDVMKAIWDTNIQIGVCMFDYILSESDKEKARVNFDRALNGEAFTCEEEYGDEQINRFYYEDKYSPIFDHENKIIGICVLVNDITIRRIAELEKLKKEARFRELFEHSGDGVAVHNTKGKFIEVNANFSKLFGYTVSDFSNLSIQDLGYENQSNTIKGKEELENVLKEGRTDYENDMKKKDGTAFRAHIISSKIEIGNEVLIQCIMRDISATYKQHQVLKKFENIFTFSNDLIAVANFDGYFQELNPKWSILLGYTLAELKSKPVIEFVHHEDKAATQVELENYFLGTSETIHFENRYKKRKGGYIHLQWNSIVDKEENLIYAVARDVTQQRKRERFAIDSNDLLLELSRKSHLINIDYDDFIQLVITKAVRLLNVDFCSYWSYDHAIEGIVCKYDSKNRHKAEEHFISKESHPRYFRAINKEHIVAVSNVKEDPRTSEFLKDYFKIFAIKSLIDVQIVDNNRFKGIICFESLLSRSWTIEEQSVISSITNIVNQALANSKLKAAQQALAIEKEIFQNFANSIPAKVSIKKPNGMHIFGNSLELNFWGIDQHTYCRFKAEDLVPPEYFDKINADENEIEKNGRTIYSQFIDEPRKKVLEEYKFKLSNDLIGSIVFDITESYEKNEKLVQRESELRDAQKIAMLGHYALDTLQGEWNSSEVLDQIFGIDEHYCRDVKGWLELIHPDFKESLQEYLFNDVLAQKKSFNKEYQIIDQTSGKPKWVHGLGELEMSEQGDIIKMKGTIQDISSRKKVEDKIHTISLVASHTQEGVVISDAVGQVVWNNDAFEKISGYTLVELKGQKIGRLLHGEETSEEAIKRIRDGLKDKESINVEFLSYRKDGSTFWNELKIDPIINDDGNLDGYIAIQNDVTARYNAERLLAASEDQLSRLINSVPGAVLKYKVKADGKDELLYLSDGAADIWELKVVEIFDIQRLWRMVFSEDAEELSSSLNHSYKHLTFWDHTWRIKTENGKSKWINGRGKPYKDEDDVIWDTIITDVTDALQAQEELIRTTDKYKSLLNTIEGVVWEADPLTLNFTFVSDKARDIFQYEKEDILTPGFWASRLHPDDRDSSIAYCQLQTKEGQDHNFDYRFKRKDGNYIWIRDIVTLVKENGVVVALKGIMIDVTEQKKAQLDLAKSETLFKSFTDQIPALVYLKDENKQYVFANSAKKAIHNLVGENYQGLTVKDLISESKSKHLDELDDWVLGQNTVAEVSNWSYKELDDRVFDEVKFPINLPDGTRLIGGIATDVTDSFELQQALIAEKKRAENIIEATKVGTWSYDWANDILEINERYAQILGYTAAELEPASLATWENSLHPDDLILVNETFERRKFEHNAIIEYEVRQKHKKGHWVWIRSRGSVLTRDIEKNPLKSVGTHLDITFQKNAILSIEKERAFAENIIASTEAGTWELDIVTGVIKINERWAHIIGFTQEELMPLTYEKFISLLHPDDIDHMEKSHYAHLKGKSTFHEVEFRQKHKSGNYVWVYAKGRVWERDEKGNPTRMIGTHLEIDKRKKGEIEIFQQQKNIENIIEATRAGTWSIDLTTNKMEINHRFATMFGCTKEEIEPLFFGDLGKHIHKDDIVPSRQLFQDHIDGKSPYYESEFRIKHKEGHWVWVLDRGRVIDRDESGKPLKVYGTHLDITKRKFFESELLENREKYKSLAENTSDIVALFDKDFNIQYISPSVKKVLGYEVDEYLEFNALSRVHHDDHHIILDIFVGIESGTDEFTKEYRIYRADDRVIWIQTRTKVVRDKTGSVINILTSSNDVTSRKVAEYLLREANDQLQSAVETANLGIWHAVPSRDEYDWNDELCQIYDLSREEFHQNHEVWKELIVKEDRQKTTEGLRKLSEGKFVKELRFRIVTRSNKLKHLIASGYPTINDNGKLDSYIGILIDVSRLVEQEEIAKRALEDKNTLFKELHHRVKNNLQLVSSIIHLESRKLNNDIVNKFVKETNSRLLSMAQIHEQLIKIEEVDQLNIATYLDGLVKDLMNGYSDKSTKYNLQLSVPSISMHIDKVLAVGLIVNEALSNTMKYAFVAVSEGDILIELKNEDDQFQLFISDNGLGMPLNQNMKDSLGIQLIFAMVEQLDGVCKIENESGVAYKIAF